MANQRIAREIASNITRPLEDHSRDPREFRRSPIKEMKTHLLIAIVGSFIAGLVVGGICVGMYFGRFVGDSLVSLKQLEYVESGDAAFEAYKELDSTVAVYALTRHLHKLDDISETQTDGIGLVTPQDLAFEHVVALGRLAKLHEQMGRDEEAANYVNQAIDHATKASLPISDRVQLMDLVERADQQGDTP